MRQILKSLRDRSFPLHVATFLAMILPSAGLYFAVNHGFSLAVWGLLGIVILANILAMLL